MSGSLLVAKRKTARSDTKLKSSRLFRPHHSTETARINNDNLNYTNQQRERATPTIFDTHCFDTHRFLGRKHQLLDLIAVGFDN
jgi:hypothetical protein